MSDRPQLDLEQDEFRTIPTKPLARPRDLWRGVFWFGLGSLLGAFAAWHLNQWWAMMLPIPCAIWLGVSLAGLYPSWFFGKAE